MNSGKRILTLFVVIALSLSGCYTILVMDENAEISPPQPIQVLELEPIIVIVPSPPPPPPAPIRPPYIPPHPTPPLPPQPSPPSYPHYKNQYLRNVQYIQDEVQLMETIR